MTKFTRGMLLGLAVSLLVAGAAFAGPTRSDGDPDHPQITLPGGSGYKIVSGASTHRNSEVAVKTQAQVVPEHWRAVLRTYLSLIRVFAL